MKGYNSYEARLRHPEIGILDFEYLNLHPEAKAAIWERYVCDASFKGKLDQVMSVDVMFKSRFKDCFKSFMPKEERSR